MYKHIDETCKAMTGFTIWKNFDFGFPFQILLLSLPALSIYYVVSEQRDSCIPLAGVMTMYLPQGYMRKLMNTIYSIFFNTWVYIHTVVTEHTLYHNWLWTTTEWLILQV